MSQTEAEKNDPAHLLGHALMEAHLDIRREEGCEPLHGMGRHRGYLRLGQALVARGIHVPNRQTLLDRCEHVARLHDRIRLLEQEIQRLQQKESKHG